MVKITTLYEEEKQEEETEEVNPVPQEEGVTPELFKEVERKYSRPLNPYTVASDTVKTEKLNTRITENLGNTLRVYTELNNISISTFIEELITEKFEGKKINRDYYNTEETLIALPLTVDLIKEYAEEEVNLIVNHSEITKGYPISPFDKQYKLLASKNPPLKLVYIGGTNNYLDQLDIKNNVYYSKLGSHLRKGYDIFRELEEEVAPKDILKQHLGLIIYPVNDMKEYNKEINEYTEIPVPEENLFLYLLVYEYDNKITKVQIINRKTAINLALEVENTDLLKYINNSQDLIEFKPITETYEIIENQKEHIQELEEKIKELEEENTQLRTYTKTTATTGTVTVPVESSAIPENVPDTQYTEYLETLLKTEELLKSIKKTNKQAEDLERLCRIYFKLMDKK